MQSGFTDGPASVPGTQPRPGNNYFLSGSGEWVRLDDMWRARMNAGYGFG